jgi:exopolyphosphatase/guanosine-5'-triphosphate,3'-diphosphate pyrophosphatase
MISIDLGSNTFRCIEYDCTTKTFKKDFEKIVKTADGMHESGRIDEKALKRILSAIHDANLLYDFKKHTVKAVTTAAMRMAENSAQALRQIKEEGGLEFEIIDADQEAAFTLKAVDHRLKRLALEGESYVLVDIGGGSTEVIFVYGEVVQSQSFPLGIVGVAQQCGSADEIHALLKQLSVPVDSFIETCYRRYGKPQSFVYTAGTPTTIAAFLQGMTYKTYDASKINGYRLGRAGCRYALEKLMAMPEGKRAEYVGVGRETLIIAGIVIVQMFYGLLGFDEAVVIDDGVREGVAIDYCEKLEGAASSKHY